MTRSSDRNDPPGGILTRARRVILGLATLLIPTGAQASPAVGEAAPPFVLQGSDGAEYTLESLLAERGGVVLAWFPRAFTPG